MGRTEEQLEAEKVDSTLRAPTERSQMFGRSFRDRFGTDRNRVRPPRSPEVDPAQVDALPAERRVHLGQSMWASIEELRDFGRRLSDSFARSSLEDLVEDLERSFVLYETAASRSEIELTATRSTLRRLEDRYRAERGHKDAPLVMPRHAPISEALDRAVVSVESLVGISEAVGDTSRTSAFRVVESAAQIRRILVDLVRSDVRVMSAELRSPIGQSVVAVRRSEISGRQGSKDGVAFVGSSLKLPPPGDGAQLESLTRSVIDQGAFAWTIEARLRTM